MNFFLLITILALICYNVNATKRYSDDEIVSEWISGFAKLKCDLCTQYTDNSVMCKNCKSRTDSSQYWQEYHMQLNDFQKIWGQRLYQGDIFVNYT